MRNKDRWFYDHIGNAWTKRNINRAWRECRFLFLIIMIICVSLMGKIIRYLESGKNIQVQEAATAAQAVKKVENGAIIAAITAAVNEYRKSQENWHFKTKATLFVKFVVNKFWISPWSLCATVFSICGMLTSRRLYANLKFPNDSQADVI